MSALKKCMNILKAMKDEDIEFVVSSTDEKGNQIVHDVHQDQSMANKHASKLQKMYGKKAKFGVFSRVKKTARKHG
jgi:hypothetical protein